MFYNRVMLTKKKQFILKAVKTFIKPRNIQINNNFLKENIKQ